MSAREAYEKTFEWIYGDTDNKDNPWSKFNQWLEGDSQLYWITGKAGSGKSTLLNISVTIRVPFNI
jgi:ABC-type lipoprotein export system ATPase subunit